MVRLIDTSVANIISQRRMERIRVLGGATIALVFALAIKTGLVIATVLGVIGGIVLLVLSLRHEHRRLTPVVLSSPAARAAATRPSSPDRAISPYRDIRVLSAYGDRSQCRVLNAAPGGPASWAARGAARLQA